MDQKTIGILSELGLSRNEATVYYALLNLGPTSVLKISYESGIKRSTIYPILNSLVEKDLVNIQVRGVKQVFVAENPEKLEVMVEKRRHLLKNTMPDLNALYFDVKGSESFIKHYRGLESIKSLFGKVLHELKDGDFCYVISDVQKWRSMMPRFYDDFIAKRAQLDIDSKVLIEDSEYGREMTKRAENIKAQVKLLKTEQPLNAYTMVLKNMVIIAQTHAPYTAMTIENQSIVDMNIELFNTAWSVTKG